MVFYQLFIGYTIWWLPTSSMTPCVKWMGLTHRELMTIGLLIGHWSALEWYDKMVCIQQAFTLLFTQMLRRYQLRLIQIFAQKGVIYHCQTTENMYRLIKLIPNTSLHDLIRVSETVTYTKPTMLSTWWPAILYFRQSRNFNPFQVGIFNIRVLLGLL